MINHEIRTGKLSIGKVPLVVGTVSSAEFLSSVSAKDSEQPCDLVEVRLDHIPEAPWRDHCDRIEGSGMPILLTVRLENEGGKWTGSDRERLPLFEKALDHVSMVDVELKSAIAREVSALARKKEKIALVSYHDFLKTPRLDELTKIVREAREFAQVVKVSTMIRGDWDMTVLEGLLAVDWGIPICVIGMGPLGTRSRLEFPCLGSCLTYGYLDKPAAPGQLSASELSAKLGELRSFASART